MNSGYFAGISSVCECHIQPSMFISTLSKSLMHSKILPLFTPQNFLGKKHQKKESPHVADFLACCVTQSNGRHKIRDLADHIAGSQHLPFYQRQSHTLL